MAWDGRRTMTGVGRAWVEQILRIPRSECLERARAALGKPRTTRPSRATDGGISHTSSQGD